jgi:hypothetical protein
MAPAARQYEERASGADPLRSGKRKLARKGVAIELARR